MRAVSVLVSKILKCSAPSPVKPPPRTYVEGYGEVGAVQDPRRRYLLMPTAEPPPEFVMRDTEDGRGEATAGIVPLEEPDDDVIVIRDEDIRFDPEGPQEVPEQSPSGSLKGEKEKGQKGILKLTN